MMADSAFSFRVQWSDDDDVYVATVPEFDGISGIGESAEEAVREAKVAVELAIETYGEEGWLLPTARKVSEYSGQFCLRLPQDLHASLVQRAEDNGASLNSYVMALLARGVGRGDFTNEFRAEFARIYAFEEKRVPLDVKAPLSD